MKRLKLVVVLATLVLSTSSLNGQTNLPKPGPEFDVLKSEVGTWDVEIKTWQGPGEPTVTKGKEVDRMLGGFWLVVDFQGKMMGMDFAGHGTYSYDPVKKQYVGSWIDSFSPNKMDMVGKYDKAKKTLTYTGMAPGPDGKMSKHVLATRYKDDGRVMTMHMEAGGHSIKVFEMNYTKAKTTQQSK